MTRPGLWSGVAAPPRPRAEAPSLPQPPTPLTPAEMGAGLSVTISALRHALHLLEWAYGSLLDRLPVGPQPVVRLPLTGYPLARIEREVLVQALRYAGGVQRDAAALLALSPRSLHYRVKTLKISHAELGLTSARWRDRSYD